MYQYKVVSLDILETFTVCEGLLEHYLVEHNTDPGDQCHSLIALAFMSEEDLIEAFEDLRATISIN